MIAEKMKPYVKNNSAIRMMFEEGNRLGQFTGQRMYLISVWEIPVFRHRTVCVRLSLIWLMRWSLPSFTAI